MKNLLKDNKELMKQWDYSKNKKFDINKITIGNKNKAWWICPKGHEWYQRIYHISNGIGCPKCKNDIISKKLSKKVYQFSPNGKLIREYSSLAQAELETKINRSNICKACKDSKYTAGGYIWNYKK